MGPRLLAVDALRGMTVAGMILVNNPGDWGHIYAPLRHADWHGWTPTDLVFPFFLFVVGISIALSLGPRVEGGAARTAMVAKVIRRAVILFALGLLLAGFPFLTLREGYWLRPELASIRIPGVLQRIAVCYLLASLLFLFTGRHVQRVVLVGCLLGYWALMTLVPIPGQGAPDIDGKSSHLAAYLDRLLLEGHLWRHSRDWDPEGVLSTMGALATTLLGVFAGRTLRSGREPIDICARLLVNGATLVALGYVWDLAFPINKPIWTSSYAVFTAGQALCCLGVLTWVIDVRGHRGWVRPFEIYGLNAITVFVGSGLLARSMSLVRWSDGEGTATLRTFLYRELFASWLPTYPASLAWALTWITCWFGALWLMARRGWILKV